MVTDGGQYKDFIYLRVADAERAAGHVGEGVVNYLRGGAGNSRRVRNLTLLNCVSWEMAGKKWRHGCDDLILNEAID